MVFLKFECNKALFLCEYYVILIFYLHMSSLVVVRSVIDATQVVLYISVIWG